MDALAESASLADALAMVRAYLRRELSEVDDSLLREPFRKLDHTFPPRNALEQVRLLAGETLYQMTTLPTKRSTTVAALAILANPDPEGEMHVVEHLRPAVDAYLEREGGNVRVSPELKPPKIVGFDKALFGRLGKVADAAALAKEIPALGTFFVNLDGRLKLVQEDISRHAGHLGAIAEETNILWHLLGESCELGSGPEVAERYPKALGFVVPLEVSELTRLLPPPPSYKQLLGRELRGFGADPSLTLTAAESFAELPDQIVQKILSLRGYAGAIDLCPMLKLANSAGRESLPELTMSSLSEQLYIEFLLMRAIGDDA